MANSAPGGGANDYNTKIIEEFRANGLRTQPWIFRGFPGPDIIHGRRPPGAG